VSKVEDAESNSNADGPDPINIAKNMGGNNMSLFTSRWRAYDYEELINRDKTGLDIFWLRDASLEESDNLPDPDVLAQEIVEDLEAALEQFREIAVDLRANSVSEQDP
jgi:hypothetical protein